MCFNICGNIFVIARKTEQAGTYAVTFSLRFPGNGLVSLTAV